MTPYLGLVAKLAAMDDRALLEQVADPLATNTLWGQLVTEHHGQVSALGWDRSAGPNPDAPLLVMAELGPRPAFWKAKLQLWIDTQDRLISWRVDRWERQTRTLFALSPVSQSSMAAWVRHQLQVGDYVRCYTPRNEPLEVEHE